MSGLTIAIGVKDTNSYRLVRSALKEAFKDAVCFDLAARLMLDFEA